MVAHPGGGWHFFEKKEKILGRTGHEVRCCPVQVLLTADVTLSLSPWLSRALAVFASAVCAIIYDLNFAQCLRAV